MKLQKMREMMAAVVAIMGATFLSVAHASDWDTVVAFYPFDDQAAGANAAGATVENMIDSSVGPGTVSNGTGTGATATFDSEAPGRYVYASASATVPAYTNPASLHLTADSSVRGGAGKVVFTGLGNELSVRPNAHTIEYFFKMDDSSFGQWVSQITVYGGYVYSGGEQPFRIYMPMADGASYDYGRRFYATLKDTTGRSRYTSLPYDVWDGKWHHIAIVATNNTIQTWVDYTRYSAVDLAVDGTVDTSLTRNITLGGPLHARYSCVRVSSRALGVDGFMRAVNQLPVSMGEDTAAFYPFNEYPSDVEATAATVRNVCSPLLGEGKVSNGADATAQATFDSDAPGKYVFFGTEVPSVPVYTNPASLHLTADSSVRGSAGSILFGNLGNVLASSPGSHTFEYFFKMDDAAFGQYLTHLNMQGGYLFSDGTEQALNLYMPFADGSDSGRQFRYSIKNYDGNRTATQTLTYNLWDGKWHHVAVVATNSKVQVWVDYKQYGSVTVDGTRSSTATRNIKLGGALHARYSCVRASTRALGRAEFLRVSNLETYTPLTGFHWTFDGPEGTVLPSVLTNAVDSQATLNPDMYATTTGNGSVNNRSTATYGGRLMRTHMLVSDGFGGNPRTNEACARFESLPLGSGYYRSGPNVAFTMTGDNANYLLGDFTVEGFFKFDKHDWLDTNGALPSGRHQMTLFSVSRPSSTPLVAWSFSIINAMTTPRIRLSAYPQDGGSSTVSQYSESGKDFFNDGKWHHVAVSYDKTRHRFIGYYDYSPVVTNQLSAPIGYVSNGDFYVGNGSSINENAFHGWVDEVRLRCECLEPEHFLRQTSVPTGFRLIYR